MKHSISSSSDKPKELFQAEIIISWVLRVGIILCATVISIGLGIRFFFPSHASGSARKIIHEIMQGQISNHYSVLDSAALLSEGVLHGNSDAWISLGLFLLILLPIIRVAMSFFIFLFEKDFTYSAITFIVLGILVFGILFGKNL